MEELIKKVTEKAGINPDQAKKAVMSVIDFIQEKFPGVGDKVKGLLEGGGDNPLGNIADKIGGMFKK